MGTPAPDGFRIAGALWDGTENTGWVAGRPAALQPHHAGLGPLPDGWERRNVLAQVVAAASRHGNVLHVRDRQPRHLPVPRPLFDRADVHALPLI